MRVFGVLPETKNKSTGSAPRVSSGSIITDLYIMSDAIPLHNFKGSGSTPRGSIPDLWEYSRKSGIALLGVLPNPLKSYTAVIMT